MPPLANASEAVATDAEIDNYVLPIIVNLRLALTRIWSLCLSLAILGAVAAYQLADFRAYIPFGALSFAALMVTRPTAVLFSRALAGPAPPR